MQPTQPADYCTTQGEAKSRGDMYYWTGRACRHGHVAARWASSNICVGCKRTPDGQPRKAYTRSKWKHLKQEALRRYSAGEFYTDIVRSIGVPMSTLCRWAHQAGINRDLSTSKAMALAKRPGGAKHLGLKGAFQGKKSGWIATDSAYEWARLLQLEEDESVARVHRCEMLVRYLWQGISHTYMPDFEVTLTDGSVRIEEVKPDKFWAHPKTAAKLEAGRIACECRGVTFTVVGESIIGQASVTAAANDIRSRSDPEFKLALKERRKEQRRRAQKRLYRKRRATNTPEQAEAERAYFRDMSRAYRARKKIHAHAVFSRDNTQGGCLTPKP